MQGWRVARNAAWASYQLQKHLGLFSAQARRFDGFSWPARFAFIKMDVERAEQLLRRAAPMVWSFELLNTRHRLGSSKTALLESFARWQYHFFLYLPARNQLMPYTPDPQGHFPPRQDDNVLAIHDSAVDWMARGVVGVQ